MMALKHLIYTKAILKFHPDQFKPYGYYIFAYICHLLSISQGIVLMTYVFLPFVKKVWYYLHLNMQ